jgi:hypothetical protein
LLENIRNEGRTLASPPEGKSQQTQEQTFLAPEERDVYGQNSSTNYWGSHSHPASAGWFGRRLIKENRFNGFFETR